MSSFLLGVLRFIREIFCASPPSQHEKLQPPEVIVTAPSPQTEHPPHPPHPHPQHPPVHKPHINDNLVNQDNEHYKQLRSQARQEGDEMARSFEESHAAYQSGDGARAKQLSNKGNEHKRKMNELNAQASEWIFRGEDSGPGEVDLHGLFVKEAVAYTEQAIQSAKARGDREIRLIVGKYNLLAHLDEKNSGVLIVTLDGESVSEERKLGSDDIIRRIERNDRECVIM
ncbi:hypothetical protein Clacol_000749 [Clathrus columnatus]|uniref:DUF1771 domain-containing protein n=1 Tax=Clathrus columnatus TaxID=1419009 RepID=A0AAV4ZX50_9AGAM|nr:hypothetical protein Clacol_000749 [Clathrus columnatus]